MLKTFFLISAALLCMSHWPFSLVNFGSLGILRLCGFSSPSFCPVYLLQAQSITAGDHLSSVVFSWGLFITGFCFSCFLGISRLVASSYFVGVFGNTWNIREQTDILLISFEYAYLNNMSQFPSFQVSLCQVLFFIFSRFFLYTQKK